MSNQAEISSAQTPNEDETKASPKLCWLPYDIFCHIASQSSICSMTCFGLTNKLFYKHLKLIHPKAIPLFSRSERTKYHNLHYSCLKNDLNVGRSVPLGSIGGLKRLGALLKGWMGPKYRMWTFHGHTVFLDTETYGTVTGPRSEKVDELRRVYQELQEWRLSLSGHPLRLQHLTYEKGSQTYVIWKENFRPWSRWSRNIDDMSPEVAEKWRNFIELSYSPPEAHEEPLTEEERRKLLNEGIRMIGL
ncbi:uncharacterized protein RSE6_14484 [Rhynchosporium secalis]|uniref:Uncharacterized protein n=1 Tax=Rhynchosporium secalis TaxID=38038 RepID=A0A1E1MVH1_RHYSE|nr:uncharacterized protein RSE6_14484 [Rhynchosporium secalis]